MFYVGVSLCEFLIFGAIFVSVVKCDFYDEDEMPSLAEEDVDFSLVDDMILSPNQYDILYNNAGTRTGWGQAVRIWPSSNIPYMVDNNFTAAEKSLIRTSMNSIHKNTCVKFERIQKPREHKDFLYIQAGHGCAAPVGFLGGKQNMYLQKGGCMDQGRILHEFVHVLGFFHMHTSIFRDKYVKIKWVNILQSTVQNFAGYESDVSMYGTEYDFESITHYPEAAFSKNGEPTIVAKNPAKNKLMGQRSRLSKGDITRINRMYNCA